MRKKLLSTILAFMAIALSLPTYAQISQEAKGVYSGQLIITVDGGEADPIQENVYLTDEDDTHVTLQIKNFSFATLQLGDITVQGVELQKDGNTINLLPKTVDIDLKIIGKVKVSLEQSTIINNQLVLSLGVSPYGGDLDIHVGFEGTNTSTGIYDVSTENKPTVYYDATTGSIVVKGAENLKYEIFNLTGVQTMTGVIASENINVSNLTKGIYLIKIGNNTVKFIKQ